MQNLQIKNSKLVTNVPKIIIIFFYFPVLSSTSHNLIYDNRVKSKIKLKFLAHKNCKQKSHDSNQTCNPKNIQMGTSIQNELNSGQTPNLKNKDLEVMDRAIMAMLEGFCRIDYLCLYRWPLVIVVTCAESFWAQSWHSSVTKSNNIFSLWIMRCATCATKSFARWIAWIITKAFIIDDRSTISIQPIQQLKICSRIISHNFLSRTLRNLTSSKLLHSLTIMFQPRLTTFKSATMHYMEFSYKILMCELWEKMIK